MNKKILFILHLPPPVHGAAMIGKYIQESQIIKENFDADFINLSTSQGLEEIGKGGLQKLMSIVRLQRKVFSALTKKKYNLCYMTLTAQGPGFFKDMCIVALLKLFGKKIIFHFHNKGVATNQHKMIYDLCYGFVFKGTRSILLSKYLYPDIQKYVNPDQVYYCANGIPTAIGEGSSNHRKNRKDQPFRILFLSNMMAEKGVWILLEACKILKEQKINLECHFIGAWSDITEPDFNQKVQSNHLESQVFAHGKKYNEEKNAFFLQADLFVFPTYYHNETFGLVNLEAMQFELPIISTAEGGIPDVVKDGETGFLIPKKDSFTLAEKIRVFIDNSEMGIQFGKAGRQRYLDLFTLEAFEKNMTDILIRAHS